MTMLNINLNRAVNRFGDKFRIIRTSGDKIILGRISLSRRFSQPWNVENLRMGIFGVMPVILGGDILYHIKNDTYYFVYLLGKETISDTEIAQHVTLLKINKTCAIYRLSGTAGSMGGTKQSFTVVEGEENIKVHLRSIDLSLRAERPALLEGASFLLYTKSDTNILILDRVTIDGVNYLAEAIDKVTFSGLYELQISLDKR